MSMLWPRLDRANATAALQSLQGSHREQIYAVSTLKHPAATFASTGGARAGEADLERLRTAIVDTAALYGFPGPPTDVIRFDRTMAVVLLEAMPMSEGEALVHAVWSHAALVLAPDVTHWRFVRGDGRWNPERWVCTDRTRHMFGRLWWQASQLTIATENGRDTRLLDSLLESELNHLTERTTIGGFAPLVQALAATVIGLPPERRQRDVVRQAALLLLRRTGVVDPYSLTPPQLRALAAHALADATRALHGAGSGFQLDAGC